MKKHNFYAGPSILSDYTIKNTAAAVENFAGMGLSLLEISHRSKEFVAVNDEARALIKELLDVPAGYEVVFLGGGASMQFCMVPYNLLNKKASYLDTGTWSSKAIKEAKLFGEVEVVASSKDKNYTYIPKDYTIAEDADYFHITTNNTIYGTEIRQDLDVKQRLVADMSSDIFSRPVDVSKYDIIYAGAQKNLAPAGVTLAIFPCAVEHGIALLNRSLLTFAIHRQGILLTPSRNAQTHLLLQRLRRAYCQFHIALPWVVCLLSQCYVCLIQLHLGCTSDIQVHPYGLFGGPIEIIA